MSRDRIFEAFDMYIKCYPFVWQNGLFVSGALGAPAWVRAGLLTFFHLIAPTCSSPKKPTWNEQVDISRSIKY
jgi:hypothetical protein